jgi:adenylylsulfate kinase-like enzyme
VEVHVSTPLEVCEQRDIKGLYKLARAGKIPNMTGVNSPYEAPDAPDYVADATSASVESIVLALGHLLSRGQ